VAPQLVTPPLPPKPPNGATAPRLGAAPAGPGSAATIPAPELLSPHPTTKAATAKAGNHRHGLDKFDKLFMCLSCSFNAEIDIDSTGRVASRFNPC
jgi:hypothetical protein